MKKSWTVYEVSNTENSILYIGVHKTGDPEDEYLGSGGKIQQAVLEIGMEKFSKKILGVFEDKKEAYLLEKDLVTWDRIWAGELYNLKPGGEGGWEYVNVSTAVRLSRSKGGTNRALKYNSIFRKQGAFSDESRSKYNKCPIIISKRKETYKKIGHQKGDKNSCFGMKWYHNPEEKISKPFKEDPGFPWILGRKRKFKN